MVLEKEDIEQLEQSYRTAFINSLAGFRHALLVSTKSLDGYRLPYAKPSILI